MNKDNIINGYMDKARNRNRINNIWIQIKKEMDMTKQEIYQMDKERNGYGYPWNEYLNT